METVLYAPSPYSPPSAASPYPEREKLLHWAQLAATVFGVACLLDAWGEAFSLAGEPSPYGEIYTVYFYVLAAYSAAREWQKWVDPGAADAPRSGHVFVPAWLGFASLIWFLGYSGLRAARPHWPEHLTKTLGEVLSFYFGTRVSGILRGASARSRLASAWHRRLYPVLPSQPVHAPAPAPLPSPEPAPSPSPAPTSPPAQGPVDDPIDEPDLDVPTRGEHYFAISAAAQRLGSFTPEDVHKATGIIRYTVKYYLLVLLQEQLIQKIARGKYKWIGPAQSTEKS